MAPLDSPHLEVSEQLGRDELWLEAGRLLRRLSESVSTSRGCVCVCARSLIRTVFPVVCACVLMCFHVRDFF